MTSPGIRPLTVGAGVIRGIEVLLSAKISDIADEVSKEAVAEDEAKAVPEEMAPLEFVTAKAIRCRMAACAVGSGIVELAEVFRKQFGVPAAELG